MLGFLPPLVLGVIAFTLLLVNTLFWCALLFLLALVKLAIPLRAVRPFLDRTLNAVATSWIACNSAWMRLTQRTEWDVEGVDALAYEGWYLVNSNHQSWVDIFVLQHLLNRRIPMLKFFLKRQLLYVPVMGLAWWALEFPFMRRHSDAYLKANPQKRFDDIETARRACEKFARVPTSVMNFADGTRFTTAKHQAQKSPYTHLLKPKGGALGLALGVLGAKFHSLLDVTIVYPRGAPTFWDFLCGRTRRIVVRVRQVEIPAELLAGDYAGDSRHRKALQRWLQEIWREKDAQIASILGEARHDAS
ncbi:MAG: acyltransferase [Burkholderiaceae bacterium]|nr:acyltransferase [Burkholderiaceae bacterium]